MTKIGTGAGRVSTSREIVPSVSIGARPVFTVTELMKRYPDGNIPEMPGREERRVRKLARRRLAEAGVVFRPLES